MQLVALKVFSYRAQRLAVGQTFDASERDGALLVRIGQARHVNRAPFNGGPPLLLPRERAALEKARAQPVAEPAADAVEPPAPVEPLEAPAPNGDDEAPADPAPEGSDGNPGAPRPRKRYIRRDLTPED